jgi:hypothetical protein
MAYEVDFTHEFEVWWNNLDADEQESVDFSVRLLEERGIYLKRPHADAVHDSTICVSCDRNIKADRTGCFTLLIRRALRFS